MSKCLNYELSCHYLANSTDNLNRNYFVMCGFGNGAIYDSAFVIFQAPKKELLLNDMMSDDWWIISLPSNLIDGWREKNGKLHYEQIKLK